MLVQCNNVDCLEIGNISKKKVGTRCNKCYKGRMMPMRRNPTPAPATVQEPGQQIPAEPTSVKRTRIKRGKHLPCDGRKLIEAYIQAGKSLDEILELMRDKLSEASIREYYHQVKKGVTYSNKAQKSQRAKKPKPYIVKPAGKETREHTKYSSKGIAETGPAPLPPTPPETEPMPLPGYLIIPMSLDEGLIIIESYCKKCNCTTTKLISTKSRIIICTGCGRQLTRL